MAAPLCDDETLARERRDRPADGRLGVGPVDQPALELRRIASPSARRRSGTEFGERAREQRRPGCMPAAHLQLAHNQRLDASESRPGRGGRRRVRVGGRCRALPTGADHGTEIGILRGAITGDGDGRGGFGSRRSAAAHGSAPGAVGGALGWSTGLALRSRGSRAGRARLGDATRPTGAVVHRRRGCRMRHGLYTSGLTKQCACRRRRRASPQCTRSRGGRVEQHAAPLQLAADRASSHMRCSQVPVARSTSTGVFEAAWKRLSTRGADSQVS